MNSLEKSIKNWCRLHPDDTTSEYILQGFAESKAKKKAEAKKWKMIASALERIGEDIESSKETVK